MKNQGNSYREESWIYDLSHLPLISFVIPVYNEAKYITSCIDSILAQNYPLDKIEIHVVDGASEDGSPNLVKERFVTAGLPVILHENPARKTPSALNIGVKAAKGEVIVILGAHTQIQSDFVIKNTENLRQRNVYCSGGTQVNVGKSKNQSSIGVAMSHWFGIPTASYRYKRNPGYVNTVVYGAYRREIFDEIGYFDEGGTISEDAEFNWRILKVGHKIYYDPQIITHYYPRKNLYLLGKQMFKYGILRFQVFRKHKEGLIWLHFVPPFTLFFFLALGLISFIVPAIIPILVSLTLFYLTVALVSAIQGQQAQKKGCVLLIFIAFVTMHVSWALGFWIGFMYQGINFHRNVA